jgi:4-hydroxy-tetrahydrodipicolinate synthase
MTAAPSQEQPPFGRVITAMVTPMRPDLSLDLDGAQRLASHLVDAGNDALVVNGTTGESATTTDHEQELLVRAVVEAVGDRALVIGGASSNDTVHAVERARLAHKAGAHGLLIVTPYYNRPQQEGVRRHLATVADATPLPVMLYDIPGRTGVAIDVETVVRLAEDVPQVVAVKDAKADLAGAAWAMRRTNLTWYSGDDILTLPFLSLGAAGVVSVCSHVATRPIRSMVQAHVRGDVTAAAQMHQQLLPVFTGMFRLPGVVSAKAALAQLGLPAGPVRPPMVDATEVELAQLVLDLADGGIEGFAA